MRRPIALTLLALVVASFGVVPAHAAAGSWQDARDDTRPAGEPSGTKAAGKADVVAGTHKDDQETITLTTTLADAITKDAVLSIRWLIDLPGGTCDEVHLSVSVDAAGQATAKFEYCRSQGSGYQTSPTAPSASVSGDTLTVSFPRSIFKDSGFSDPSRYQYAVEANGTDGRTDLAPDSRFPIHTLEPRPTPSGGASASAKPGASASARPTATASAEPTATVAPSLSATATIEPTPTGVAVASAEPTAAPRSRTTAARPLLIAGIAVLAAVAAAVTLSVLRRRQRQQQ